MYGLIYGLETPFCALYLPARHGVEAFLAEDSQLIADLHSLHKKSPKLLKPVRYAAPAIPEIAVESWRMNEFKYYNIPSPFPTLARGLFSVEEMGSNEASQSRYRIVARGYDKFFNIGEVPWTFWSSLESHTKPPYTLTLKSNGCIIFIAALSPSKLLITSKHSVGPVQGVPESHAQAGERWLRHHLEQVGKTTEQLAGVLWEKNWTAVAELCDDSFEEHVLPYPAEKTGMHLHGLNDCSRHFKTQPTSVVDEFAREWGFIVTISHELPSISQVRAFTEEIGRTGKWNGEALEGFVVRTNVALPPTDGASPADGASPYAPGSSFFFKIKFDEPYMMYRDWREITKSLLSKGESASLPKNKMKRPETKTYVQWVRREIKNRPKLFEGYAKGHGIIATRDRFFEWLETEEGKRSARADETSEAHEPPDERFGKTIIMPIAVPGVGTQNLIAVALVELFRFGHTQSDDVRAKKPARVFIQNVKTLLRDHDVVIADKNNHLRQHREDLRDAIKAMHPPVRLLALNWSLDQPHAAIHRICADRVLARGANHQTLHGDITSKSHEDVLWQFLRSAQPLNDDEADATVEMDIGDDLEHSLARAIDGVVRVLGLPRPDAERVGAALAKARGYKPAAHTDAAKQVTAKAKARAAPRYFGLLAEIDLVDALDAHILKRGGRVTRHPHVTIVHSKNREEHPEQYLALWERCEALHALPAPPLFRARLGHVVADERMRIMAVTVEDLRVDDPLEGDEGQEGASFVSKLDAALRERLHVTVGTKDASVPAVEAGALVGSFRKGGTGKGLHSLPLEGVYVSGRIKGLFS
ncbi:RNA ligase-domain-containing protein [Russula compacta]|nr:RNA ligase-domain-containing protein [Russula compacta]